VRIARLALSFSLLILLLAATLASLDYSHLDRTLEGASREHAAEVLRERRGELVEDPELQRAVAQFLERPDDLRRLQYVRSMVRLRAAADADASFPEAAAQARAIKASPLYRDSGERQSSNWLSGAVSRLARLIPRLRPAAMPDIEAAPRLGSWLIYTVWTVLAIAAILFGVFAIRHFAFHRALKRRATALLDEDEPERTLDEWLATAERLEREGRHREAVRCLYLACLLKLDEHGVARFVRGQTNWEHLGRIQGSANKPSALDFSEPTRAFDRVWYGMRVRGSEDVGLFRGWYRDLTGLLEAKR
jgi:hypothetical protein